MTRQRPLVRKSRTKKPESYIPDFNFYRDVEKGEGSPPIQISLSPILVYTVRLIIKFKTKTVCMVYSSTISIWNSFLPSPFKSVYVECIHDLKLPRMKISLGTGQCSVSQSETTANSRIGASWAVTWPGQRNASTAIEVLSIMRRQKDSICDVIYNSNIS